MDRKPEKEDNEDAKSEAKSKKSFFVKKMKSPIVVYKMYVGNISEEGLLLGEGENTISSFIDQKI